MNSEQLLLFAQKDSNFDESSIDFSMSDGCGVYAAILSDCQKVYIGYSKNLASRLYAHKRDLLCGRHRNTCLQSDFNKTHRFNPFIIERTAFVETAMFLEVHWMSIFGLGRLANMKPKWFGEPIKNLPSETKSVFFNLGYTPTIKPNGYAHAGEEIASIACSWVDHSKKYSIDSVRNQEAKQPISF